MKNSFLIILFFFSWLSAIAQIGLNGPTLLVCPGEPMVYNVAPASQTSCQYKWIVTNGLFSNGLTTIQGLHQRLMGLWFFVIQRPILYPIQHL